jgi:short-subunit dehydrogenase
MQNVALVTGASSGIGRELAVIHAARGGDLVITARRAGELARLKAELESAYGVMVMPAAMDLAEPGAAEALHARVADAGVEVEYLINNAGFGGLGRFDKRSWDDHHAMIQLNMVALTALCRLYLPEFLDRGRGRILNVSSTAGLLPGPMQAVYYATKAYVTSLSNALAEEARGAGVTVTALLPGATATEFAARSGMDRTRLFDGAAPAAAVARAGYDGMLAGRLNVLAGVKPWQRVVLPLLPLLPKALVLRQIRAMQDTGD